MPKVLILLLAALPLQACGWTDIAIRESQMLKQQRERAAAAAVPAKAP